jgi:hypothetical protein
MGSLLEPPAPARESTPGALDVDRPVLWLFGDSFVAAAAGSTRAGATFLHNSVAFSRCREDGFFEIEYAWGRRADGSPRAVFETGHEDLYYWPQGGFVLDAALYVGLLLVAPSRDGAMPFEPIGVDLARVTNPGEDPEQWEIAVRPLSRNGRLFPAGAVLVEDEYLYLFGFAQEPNHHHPRFLSRIPLGALRRFDATLGDVLETYQEDGSWLAGLDPSRVRFLMTDDATEMSVSREPDGGRLRAVYSFPYQGDSGLDGPASRVVYTRTAPGPEGPWSAPRGLFVVAELQEDTREKPDPALRCYAAKEHPEFSTIDQLVVTYACNLMAVGGADADVVWQRLLEDTEVYRPKVVSWPRPSAP